MGERITKKAKTFATWHGVFASQRKRSENCLRLPCFNRDIIPTIAKYAFPLSIADCRHFQATIILNKRNNKVPSRRSLFDVLIPNFIKDVFRRYVTRKLISMETVPFSFKLWMSRG